MAIRIRWFPVQLPLCGEVQISEAVLSRMTQSLPKDSQIVVKKTGFFLNIFKRYCVSAFKVRKCNHVALRNSFSFSIFFLLSNQVVKIGKRFASGGSFVTLYYLLNAGLFSECCDRTRTHDHLVAKQTLNHLAKLGVLFICQVMQDLNAV